MAKQQRTPGAFLKINLPDDIWAYARILEHGSYAIYDLITSKPIKDINKILGASYINCILARALT